MTQQADLGSYTEQYGTTDDVREDVDLNPPEDGHIRRINKIHDYWHGLESSAGGPYRSQSLVPPGGFTMILDDDPDYVEHGWGLDGNLEPGIWLPARGHRGSLKPPKPILVDDDYLQFAAEACLLAAKKVVTDRRAIMLSTSLHETLTIYVEDEDRGTQEYLFDEGGAAGAPPRGDADTLHGFFSIRVMGTPAEAYTQAEVPRLTLEDLRIDIPERWSP